MIYNTNVMYKKKPSSSNMKNRRKIGENVELEGCIGTAQHSSSAQLLPLGISQPRPLHQSPSVKPRRRLACCSRVKPM